MSGVGFRILQAAEREIVLVVGGGLDFRTEVGRILGVLALGLHTTDSLVQLVDRSLSRRIQRTTRDVDGLPRESRRREDQRGQGGREKARGAGHSSGVL